MNKEVKITAIVAVITAIFDLLKVYGTDIAIDNNTVYAIVSLIVGVVIYWRNQSWTVEGLAGTNYTRTLKRCRGMEQEVVEEPESEVFDCDN